VVVVDTSKQAAAAQAVIVALYLVSHQVAALQQSHRSQQRF
jgi:hypothetical protein